MQPNNRNLCGSRPPINGHAQAIVDPRRNSHRPESHILQARATNDSLALPCALRLCLETHPSFGEVDVSLVGSRALRFENGLQQAGEARVQIVGAQ